MQFRNGQVARIPKRIRIVGGLKMTCGNNPTVHAIDHCGAVLEQARGVVAFPITPTDVDGRVDSPAFRRLVARVAASDVAALCVLGSTGTYAYLSREERRRAVEIAVDEVDGRMPVFAGIGALRTDMAVLHCEDAAAGGAAMGLLAPMSYTKLTDDEVFLHFEAVAENGGLPICIYDNPSATHFAISDELLRRLSGLPAIQAAKLAAGNVEIRQRIAALRSIAPPPFSWGFSRDQLAAEALTAGADAWYSVLAGIYPDVAAAISRAAVQGDAGTVQALTRALAPVWNFFETFGPIRVAYEAAKIEGISNFPPPRPMMPMHDAARREFRRQIANLAGLIRACSAQT